MTCQHLWKNGGLNLDLPSPSLVFRHRTSLPTPASVLLLSSAPWCFPNRFHLIPFQGSPSGTVTCVGQGSIQPMPKRDILFCPLGAAGSAGRCRCWVASQEQGLTKSFLVQGRKTCRKIAGQQGKRRLSAAALAASAVPILARPKERVCVGRRAVRWGCETRTKKS